MEACHTIFLSFGSLFSSDLSVATGCSSGVALEYTHCRSPQVGCCILRDSTLRTTETELHQRV